MGRRYNGVKYIDFRDYFLRHSDIRLSGLGIQSRTLVFVNGFDPVYISQLADYSSWDVVCRESDSLNVEVEQYCDCVLSDETILNLKEVLDGLLDNMTYSNMNEILGACLSRINLND